jgi:hypothetical protein
VGEGNQNLLVLARRSAAVCRNWVYSKNLSEVPG